MSCKHRKYCSIRYEDFHVCGLTTDGKGAKSLTISFDGKLFLLERVKIIERDSPHDPPFLEWLHEQSKQGDLKRLEAKLFPEDSH